MTTGAEPRRRRRRNKFPRVIYYYYFSKRNPIYMYTRTDTVRCEIKTHIKRCTQCCQVWTFQSASRHDKKNPLDLHRFNLYTDKFNWKTKKSNFFSLSFWNKIIWYVLIFFFSTILSLLYGIHNMLIIVWEISSIICNKWKA